MYGDSYLLIYNALQQINRHFDSEIAVDTHIKTTLRVFQCLFTSFHKS